VVQVEVFQLYRLSNQLLKIPHLILQRLYLLGMYGVLAAYLFGLEIYLGFF
jgi:hypothetical protein